MDPPRMKTAKSKKKRAGRKRTTRPAYHHDPTYAEFPIEPVPRSPTRSYSDLNSSFDELNFSDAECPALHGEAEESEDDDELVKRLYKGPRKCRCCINWVKNPPPTLISQNGPKQPSKHAVTARYSSQMKDMRLMTSLHSVTVHSQPLKDVLGDMLHAYPSINIGRGDASFYPSFEPLVHAWDDLKARISQVDGEAREHGDAFCEIIEHEIGETIKDRDDLLSRGLMTYDLLWTLYKPGARVFCTIDGSRHLMKVVRTANDLETFSVILSYWDLSMAVPIELEWSALVFRFTGSKPIEELEAVPYDLVSDADVIFDELRRRGQKIRDIPHGSLKWFEGFVTVPIPYSSDTRKKWIDGRVIIDPKEYDKTVVAVDPNMFGIQPPVPMPRRPGSSVAPETKVEATTEQLAHSSSVVRGFSFTTKSWHKFEVDGISDVEWNDNAFDQLVMPAGRKRLIKALVDSNQGRNSGFDDFIKGKGQGLIMLLSGPPGTGKTLTAESIAERIHLPLYSVHASELSNAVAGDIESKLGEILHRASHWNAVLLIDEADAFLEARNVFDLDRSQRVAVFLRLLEFYSGVLILTTNRRVTFDPAFHSRIHLTLKFEDLDHSARSSIWKNFLRAMPNNVHAEDVTSLAEANLNGRQIKNVVKMASLLAHSEGETLCTEHLETMLEAVDEIEEEGEALQDGVPF